MFREPWGRITKRRANDTSFGIRREKKQLKLLESFSWTSKLNYIDTYRTKNNFSRRKTMVKNNSTQYKLLLWNNGTNERSGINFNWYRKSSHTFIYVWENLIFPLLDIKLNRVLKVICMTLLWLLQHLFASCVPIFSLPFSSSYLLTCWVYAKPFYNCTVLRGYVPCTSFHLFPPPLTKQSL